MFRSKIVLTGLIGTAAVLMLWSQRHRLAQARTHLAGLQATRQAVQQSSEELRRSVSQARQQLREKQRALLDRRARPPADGAKAEGLPEMLSTPFPGRDFLNEHWSEAVPYIEIDKRHLPALVRQAFDWAVDELVLKEQLAFVLGLKPRDRLAVESAVADFAAKYRQLELAKLQETDTAPASAAGHPGRKTTFVVPPFPEEGEPLKNELTQGLEQAIGPTRRDLLLQIAQGEFERKFGDFGRLQRTICFAEPASQDGRQWPQTIYLCLDERCVQQAWPRREGRPPPIPREWEHLVRYTQPAQ